jgi:hypothetical protein
MKNILFLSLIVAFIISCESTKEKDEEQPDIDLSYEGTFPASCDTLRMGQTNTLIYRLTDNDELASYSVDIHHNFDQHAHPTHEDACVLDPKKLDPENEAFLHLKSVPVISGQNDFIVNHEVEIPEGIEPGDYHLKITAIDKSGWTNFEILSIKIW